MEGAGTGYSEAGRREATGLVGHATMGAVTLRPLPGSGAFGWISGGVARCSLNPRLIAGIPPGWRMAGGVVAGVSDAGWLQLTCPEWH